MCSNSSAAIMPAENVPKKSASENRRSNKPIMEKRRRARINNCLNELKNLILDALKKDPARHSKLEKADILEMTVRHLQTMQRNQNALVVSSDPNVVNKYRAGFSECVSEVGRFVTRECQIEPQIRQRLLQHLSGCLNSVNNGVNAAAASAAAAVVAAAPSPAAVSSSNPLGAFPIVPRRLPNGDFAIVVPSQYLNGSEGTGSADKPLELTVPRHAISPVSTSSMGSPSSLSPVSSDMSDHHHHHHHHHHPQQHVARPVPLVVRPDAEERPWRPW